MKVCRGKEAKMVGEEVKMVDRDGVVRRQRWCGEEAEMVWQGVTV